ncbi:uncharacterized protein RHOBADRAFT_56501 [Rhodotorula graminis WP1]|uniref:Zn(2)-C6 fungal-type domain-containing protein n=1 Tax=Rhodotorula graminis (strain WP1) TaxID=578459 RepID=A0A0P9EJ39_RHOGW|nr:uncharacterized protein RHOBADRAFT_56501 [Rhodotorula graminis WP1]KPV71668.1 hypothetical protein RHOBADRAFT_56501 [Rhodotorula graminis WP1]
MLPTDIAVAPTFATNDDGAPFPRPSASASIGLEDDRGAPSGDGTSRNRSNASVRHLSCENCRVRKMKCSRQSPCLSCRSRGDKCVWIGQAPNGSADEDELEASTNEVNRLKKLVDLLLARLEEQDEAEQQLEFYQHAQQPPIAPPPPPPHGQRRPSDDGPLPPNYTHRGGSGYGSVGPSAASPRTEQHPRWSTSGPAGAPSFGGAGGSGGARSPHVGWGGDIPVSPMQGVQLQSPQFGRRPSSFSHHGLQHSSMAESGQQRGPSFGGTGGGGGGEYGRGPQGGAVLPPGARAVYGQQSGESQRSG